MTERTYYLDIQIQTPNGGRSVVDYSPAEMAAMFSEAQMAALAAGDSVTLGLHRYTDLQAFMDTRA